MRFAKGWLGLTALFACAGLILSGLAFISPSAIADDASATTSVTDNYGYLNGSSASKQGFEAGLSNYLGGNNNFTIEMWINPADTMTSQTGTLFGKTDMLQYELASGVFQVAFNNGAWKSVISTGVRARINEWQHIAFVKSGNLFNFYLNGKLAFAVSDATNVPTSLNNASTYTSIGSNPWNGSSNQSTPYTTLFAGGFDEVRVWTTARTQSEIESNMDSKVALSTSGLASYWDFNGAATSTIYDRKGLMNFTAYGTPAPTFPDIKITVTTIGQTTVTFPRTYLNGTGGYQIPAGVTSMNVLVVGGGGGGGFDGGGGGGGGGVYQNSTLAVTPGDLVVVEVGAGGAPVNGYTGGTLACNGTWNTTVIACSATAGGTSRFVNITASGGGGGGGIENSGTSDSDASATVRGGGGGAGGQNSRSGGASPGSGAFNGGSVSDANNNGGGGGGSSSAAGSIGSSVAGNGAAGVTVNIDSQVYGSGGAGGSYSSATQATGGTNAANGGTTAVGPSSPAVNKGGGGAGGGNGGVAINAYGTAGAAGIIILRYTLKGGATLSFTSTPTYRTATTITATTTMTGKVTFLANNKKIPGCIKVGTTGSGPITASCSWKPSLHGAISITSQFVPVDTNYLSSLTTSTPAIATKRTNNR